MSFDKRVRCEDLLMVIKLLRDVRSQMHGEPESSLAMMDEAIGRLESCVDQGTVDRHTVMRVLSTLSDILGRVPQVLALLKLLSG